MALCLSHPRHGYYRSGTTDRRRRRLRHRARDQPDLRRADRLLHRQPLAADAPAAELHPARARPRPRHADGGRAARREPRRRLSRRAAPPALREQRRPARRAADAARPVLALLGAARSTRSATARSSSSPTNSSTPCRSASSCKDRRWLARAAGRPPRRQARLRPLAHAVAGDARRRADDGAVRRSLEPARRRRR